MDKAKFWGALLAALNEDIMSPETVGRIVAMVTTALVYAEEASD